MPISKETSLKTFFETYGFHAAMELNEDLNVDAYSYYGQITLVNYSQCGDKQVVATPSDVLFLEQYYTAVSSTSLYIAVRVVREGPATKEDRLVGQGFILQQDNVKHRGNS